MSPYLIAAYVAFWALPLLLLLSIWSRQSRLEQRLERLWRETNRTEAHRQHPAP